MSSLPDPNYAVKISRNGHLIWSLELSTIDTMKIDTDLLPASKLSYLGEPRENALPLAAPRLARAFSRDSIARPNRRACCSQATYDGTVAEVFIFSSVVAIFVALLNLL